MHGLRVRDISILRVGAAFSAHKISMLAGTNFEQELDKIEREHFNELTNTARSLCMCSTYKRHVYCLLSYVDN